MTKQEKNLNKKHLANERRKINLQHKENLKKIGNDYKLAIKQAKLDKQRLETEATQNQALETLRLAKELSANVKHQDLGEIVSESGKKIRIKFFRQRKLTKIKS